LPFDSKFKPDNSLVKLFSPIGGDYLVKPSQEIIDQWDSEQQVPAQGTPGIPYDARGPSKLERYRRTTRGDEIFIQLS
jgi:hypothetical protein